jgi:hypothetical protein
MARGVVVSPKEASMPQKKMLILRGNSAPAGKYPDEKGEKIAWPIGALHVSAAEGFARRLCLEPVVLPVQGQPQNQHSPQANKAVPMFRDDETIVAFYGFSGGGYNVRHILDRLVKEEPAVLSRIKWLVVIGTEADGKDKNSYLASTYNSAQKKNKEWKTVNWRLIYRTNPKRKELPEDVLKVLPKDTETHMFGPDVLLNGWPQCTCQEDSPPDCPDLPGVD